MRCVPVANGRCILLMPASWYENVRVAAWLLGWAGRFLVGEAIIWAYLYLGSMWAGI